VVAAGGNVFGNAEDIAGDCPGLSQGFGGATMPVCFVPREWTDDEGVTCD